MVPLEERCVVELHGEDQEGVGLLEVRHRAGADYLLLQLGEALLHAPDRLQQELHGCSPPLACPTSSTRFLLQDHRPNLMAMMIM